MRWPSFLRPIFDRLGCSALYSTTSHKMLTSGGHGESVAGVAYEHSVEFQIGDQGHEPAHGYGGVVMYQVDGSRLWFESQVVVDQSGVAVELGEE